MEDGSKDHPIDLTRATGAIYLDLTPVLLDINTLADMEDTPPPVHNWGSHPTPNTKANRPLLQCATCNHALMNGEETWYYVDVTPPTPHCSENCLVIHYERLLSIPKM